MAYAFFKVPCSPEPGAASALNDFLRTHSVLAVEKQWVSAGDGSFWAFCVQYQKAGGGAAMGGQRGGPPVGKVDYKEVLTAEQFQVFAKLREVRKTLADQDKLPVFAVFTNEQLAEMVRLPVKTLEDLKKITGIGEARASKYGQAVLSVLGAPAMKDEKRPELV